MKVKDIMTKSLVTLSPKDTVSYAANLMKKHNIGSLPVCDGEKVIGIITDRDITLRAVAGEKDANTQTVREIMSSNPVLGKPDMDISDAGRIMSERQIRRMPVVQNDSIVGMLSLGDLAVEPGLYHTAGEALSEISTPSCIEK